MKQLLSLLSNTLVKTSYRVNRICWFAAGIFLVAMLASVGLQVIARYLFFSPPSWTEEFARYCMIWAGLLGATVSFYNAEDPVLMKPPQLESAILKALLAIIEAGVVVIFLLPILYFSPAILTHHMDRLTESMQLNSAWVFAIVPVFAAVILFHLLAGLLVRIAAKWTVSPGSDITGNTSHIQDIDK